MNLRTRFLHLGIALKVCLQGLSRRWWGSLNAVLGTATVVGMLAAVLGIAAGYERALHLASIGDNVMVMRAGARSEMESSLDASQVRAVMSAPSVARLPDGRVAAAAEVYAVANIASRRNGEPMNVAVRGATDVSAALRPALHIVQGRMFVTGRRELIVGRRALQQYRGLALGQRFQLAGASWQVVGVFEDGGSIVESEIWTDATMLQSAYQRGDTVQLVVARLAQGASPDALEQSLNGDARQALHVVSEADYYAEQAQQLTHFARTLGFGIAVLMGLGAVFASVNTGYASVSARAKEISTLAALGLEDVALTLSVALEVCVLAIAGGVLGSLVARLLFHGHTLSTLFFSRDFSQVIFDFDVSGRVLLEACAFAVAIGAIGAIAPAWHARRLPLARILAERR
jgi:putative ABC transport system permease protein